MPDEMINFFSTCLYLGIFALISEWGRYASKKEAARIKEEEEAQLARARHAKR